MADQPANPSSPDTPDASRTDQDPIRRRRAQVAKWTVLANRVGYLFLALAMALFVIAFAVGFNASMATMIIVSLFISFALLAPSIVLGYAVKAADRDDAEHGW